MSHALLILLTPTEREQARQIWDLLGQDDDDFSGFEALKAASESAHSHCRGRRIAPNQFRVRGESFLETRFTPDTCVRI
jgi:hypothetical protein